MRVLVATRAWAGHECAGWTCVRGMDMRARGLTTCVHELNTSAWDGCAGNNGPPHPKELAALPDPDDQTYNPQNSLPY